MRVCVCVLCRIVVYTLVYSRTQTFSKKSLSLVRYRWLCWHSHAQLYTWTSSIQVRDVQFSAQVSPNKSCSLKQIVPPQFRGHGIFNWSWRREEYHIIHMIISDIAFALDKNSTSFFCCCFFSFLLYFGVSWPYSIWMREMEIYDIHFSTVISMHCNMKLPWLCNICSSPHTYSKLLNIFLIIVTIRINLKGDLFFLFKFDFFLSSFFFWIKGLNLVEVLRQ